MLLKCGKESSGEELYDFTDGLQNYIWISILKMVESLKAFKERTAPETPRSFSRTTFFSAQSVLSLAPHSRLHDTDHSSSKITPL